MFYVLLTYFLKPLTAVVNDSREDNEIYFLNYTVVSRLTIVLLDACARVLHGSGTTRVEPSNYV